MTTNLYSIKDRISNFFMQPMKAVNDAVAKRNFTELVNADPSQIELPPHISDWQLYKIGAFDENTGEIKSEVNYVCSYWDCKSLGGQSVNSGAKGTGLDIPPVSSSEVSDEQV